MNITEITQAIVAAYPSRQPIMVWGAPGVGKSSGGKAASEILGTMVSELNKTEKLGKTKNEPFGFIDLRLSLIDDVDLGGGFWPDAASKTLIRLKPEFLPTEGRGILALDEIVQATMSKQGCASQLVLDRCIGKHRLGDGWHVIAMGNRMSDKAAANAMPTHIKNRFIHLYADVDVESWVAWALNHNVDMRVIAFIKFRRPLLHQFDALSKADAFASPRSWEFVSNILRGWKGNNTLLELMIRGAVGDGPAAEFIGFLRVCDKLPSIDGILLNPKTAPIPDDMGALYATVTALVGRATKDNLANVTAYFNRVSDKGKPDFSIAAIKELTARKDASVLAQTRAFIEFASKHAHII